MQEKIYDDDNEYFDLILVKQVYALDLLIPVWKTLSTSLRVISAQVSHRKELSPAYRLIFPSDNV